MYFGLPTWLALSILLGLLYVQVAAVLATRSRGVAWNVGNRDGKAGPLSVHAQRAQRAAENYLETFPFFAVAIVAVIALQRDGTLAHLGAQLFFWARLAYLPTYIAGIPGLRSLIWGVALVGILLLVAVLF